MPNRRRFLQSGLALPAFGPLAGLSLSGPASAQGRPTLTLDRFVFDNRFPEAVELARFVAREGVPLAETDGDMTELWCGHLAPQWRRRPLPLAGMTTSNGLFVLSTLAADHRMRVIYRGVHEPAPEGVETLTGPVGLIEQASDSDPRLWSPLLARAIAHCPAGPAPPTTFKRRIPPARSRRDEPLVTWIIADRGSGSSAA